MIDKLALENQTSVLHKSGAMIFPMRIESYKSIHMLFVWLKMLRNFISTLKQ